MEKHQWALISKTVSGTRQQERMSQQAVFRLIDSLKKQDDVMFRQILDMGISPDAPMFIYSDIAPPLAKEMVPSSYPYDFVTPLAWAAVHDDVEALAKLVEAGADVSFPGPTGRDVLWLAMIHNTFHAWTWIKNHYDQMGLDIPWNARSADGKRTTRLMDAVVHRNLEAVQDMMGRVDVSAVDNTGRTALHYNFLQNPYTDVDSAIARLLINYGAPVHTEDHEGVAPLSLANTPEQEALLDVALLTQVTEEARLRAQQQRNQLEAKQPSPERDPSEPTFPQIQKPVIFKRPKL